MAFPKGLVRLRKMKKRFPRNVGLLRKEQLFRFVAIDFLVLYKYVVYFHVEHRGFNMDLAECGYGLKSRWDVG